MDGWRDILHFNFHGEHVLFSALRLSSGSNFLLASLLTVFLCTLEKTLTYVLSSKWNPLPSHNSRIGNAAFRAAIYWILTLTRLLYMLLAMTFHVGLILVAVTTLCAGQFIIEYLEPSHPRSESNFADSNAPLLGRRDFEVSTEEYLNGSIPRMTNSVLMAHGYPPRRKSKAQTEGGVAGVNGKKTVVFEIDDGEDIA